MKVINLASITFIFLIFSLTFISSAPPVTTVQQFTTGYAIQVPQDNIIALNKPYNFDFHVNNISNGVPITTGIGCYFHLYDLIGGHQFSDYDANPTFNFDYEFNLTAGNFTIPGEYYYYIECNSSSLGGYAQSIIIVNSNGEDNNSFAGFGVIIILIIISGLLFYISTLFKKEQSGIKTLFIIFGLGFMLLAMQMAKISIAGLAGLLNAGLIMCLTLMMFMLAYFMIIYTKYIFTTLRNSHKNRQATSFGEVTT